MKLASSFGKYDEEWKEGDWKVKGDVPVMMMLRKFSGSVFDAVRPDQRTGFPGGPHGGGDYSLVAYPASDRHTTPAHAADQAPGQRLAATFVAC